MSERAGSGLLATPARRRVLFAGLYLAEGAPVGFVWWALPTVLRADGEPIGQLGSLLALLVLPWALKFLWAPLVDLLRGRRGFKPWIVGAQVAMAATLLPLAFVDARASWGLVAALLLAHALAAATQDVAIDGLAIRSTTRAERGRLNGWMQAGFVGGRVLFSAGALRIRPEVGDRALVLALVGVVLALLLLQLTYREPPEPDRPAFERRREFLGVLRALAARRATWWAAAFAATGACAFEAAGAFAGPWLVDLGADPATDVSRFWLAAPAAMLLGGLAAGALGDRLGQVRAVALAGLATAAAVLAAAGLGAAGGSALPVAGALVAVYAAGGALTVASYALFMDQVDARVGATAFSALMGATNLCEAWAAKSAGLLIESAGGGEAGAGYPVALGVLAAAGLAALLFLRPLARSRAREADGAPPRAAPPPPP